MRTTETEEGMRFTAARSPGLEHTDNVNSLSEQAGTTLILYPRLRELHETIRRCQRLSRLGAEPQCMMLEGLFGAGKSTLVMEYAKAFPRVQREEGTYVSVLYVETPSPCTVKGMAARLLQELGDPAADKGPLWSMNSRLVKLISECGVELVILDDFHHLIDARTQHILNTVADWLKVLIKETCIPYLVVGVDGQVRQILQANGQLSRLFASRETLRPLYWNDADPTASKEFAQFMSYVEFAIGLRLDTPWDRKELLSRLHYATGGVVGNIMNLMRFTQDHALHRGNEVVELADLHWAFDARLQEHVSKPNPFNLNTTLRQLLQEENTRGRGYDPADGVSNRSRSKRNRKAAPDTHDVLSAS
jgi:hypothetical protein